MDERGHLEAAIAALEADRPRLGDATVDAAVGTLRARLNQLLDPRREQRKLVTVLFGDVSGFTAMAERVDPEEVTAAVNVLWRRVDATIAEHGGMVDKHIGDAVMALFGAPIAHEDDAERAVRAGLAIQSALARVTDEIGWRETELRMRIGIHTGQVHLATVGTTGEHTAMGDTVNLASRLQALATEGGVLISHETWRHVRGAFEVEPQAPVRIKGKSKPVKVYEVRVEVPPSGRGTTYGVAGIETPFVGRDEELATLRHLLDEVVSKGTGRYVTVIGEAGLGQSRLIDAFCAGLDESDAPVILMRARAFRDGGRAPFVLLRDLMASRFRILESDSDAVAMAKLRAGIEDLVDDSVDEAVQLLGHLMGLQDGGDSVVDALASDPFHLRRQAFQAVARVLTAVARRSPVALVLEELHEADESSLDLVTFLIRETQGIPILLMTTARPDLLETRPDWLESGPVRRLDLGRLGDEDAERVVRGLLAGVTALPEALVRRIVETAGGHPYYLEELVRIVLERRLQVGDDHWRLPEGIEDDLEVPPTLTALLQARLDALPADERLGLQRASVVGQVFWDETLQSFDLSENADTGKVDPSVLSSLVDRELVRERPESSFEGLREFVFGNSLLHEVAYDTVLLRDRRALHGLVAGWLAERAGDSALVWAGRIAEHWDRAAEGRRAAAWYLKAGEHARRTSAFEEAARHFGRSLVLLEGDPASASLRLSAHEGLQEVRTCQGRYGDARVACEAMLAEAEALDDAAGQARAWWGLCRLRQAASEHEAALDAIERAVDLARQAGAATTLVTATREHGQCLLRLGRLDEASAVLDRALDAARREGLKLEQAMVLRLLGAIQARQGQFASAERFGERGLALLRDEGDTVRVTASLLSLGELARVRGDAQRAAARYEEALALARRLGVLGHELVGMSNLGGARIALGQLQEGEALLRAVIERAPQSWYGLPETWRFLAEARLAAGDPDDALQTGRKALSLCLDSGNAELIGPAWRILGEIVARTGPAELNGGPMDACACFEESRRVLADAGLHPEEARTLRAWARYEIAHGDAERGQTLWKQAREWFDLLGMDLEVGRMAAPPSAA